MADPRTGSPAARRSPAARPSPAARRFGYLVAVVVNLALLWLIHVSPGWRAVPFLTDATVDVLPQVTGQLCLGVAVNVVWVLADPRWLRRLGELVTSAVGLAVAARLLVVFPFAFDPDGPPWQTLVRLVLWLAVIGSAIAVLVAVVDGLRALGTEPPRES